MLQNHASSKQIAEGYSAQKRKRADGEHTAMPDPDPDPCIVLSILLAGCGVGAGLPGCAISRAPSTLQSWPSARIVSDLQARANLKAMWLQSKLVQSHPAERRFECASASQLLSRASGSPPLTQWLRPASLPGCAISRAPSTLRSCAPGTNRIRLAGESQPEGDVAPIEACAVSPC